MNRKEPSKTAMLSYVFGRAVCTVVDFTSIPFDSVYTIG